MKPRTRQVLLWAIPLLLFVWMDAGFTLYITSNGGIELNPIMRFWLELGPHVFIGSKLVLGPIVIGVLYKHSLTSDIALRILKSVTVFFGCLMVYYIFISWKFVL